MTTPALSGNFVIDNLYADTIKANFRKDIYGRTKVFGVQRNLRTQASLKYLMCSATPGSSKFPNESFGTETRQSGASRLAFSKNAAGLAGYRMSEQE